MIRQSKKFQEILFLGKQNKLNTEVLQQNTGNQFSMNVAPSPEQVGPHTERISRDRSGCLKHTNVGLKCSQTIAPSLAQSFVTANICLEMSLSTATADNPSSGCHIISLANEKEKSSL